MADAISGASLARIPLRHSSVWAGAVPCEIAETLARRPGTRDFMAVDGGAGEGSPTVKELCVLLGRERALILTLLETSMTPSQLAAALGAAPSVATHHLRAMERADLIERERSGRYVIVRRTAR
ncbi:MAG: winged helix-turn-helix domain-containing protein, partial [Actinomycetota bacterium]|nr:winged helix-turn-helix domain-containing protein [Actinomycetota bacterium]